MKFNKIRFTTFWIGCGLFLVMCVLPAFAASTVPHPNFIVIYSDDHGYADLSAHSVDKNIRTPNLDALAASGVRFVRGYVSAPQCVPSRAGLITGRYQQKFGVEDNTQGPLPLTELTIAERLKRAGYVSGQVGKWHLEPPPDKIGHQNETANQHRGAIDFYPLHQGFDEFYTGQMDTFYASHDLQGHKLTSPRMLSDKRFRCSWQTDAALQFIDRHAREPFFLYLAYFTPHVPLESPEPWFSRTPTNLPLERRQALAMIACMDDGIGQLRAKLRAEGIATNTLIFFESDNGAPLKAGAWDGSLNLPLVGEKGMLTDGGVRTPFLCEWPGTLPAGINYEPPVINLDIAATVVAVAGLPLDDKLDGVNLLPFLTGQKNGNPHDALYWRWRSQAAIRADHWKYIMLGEHERYLFDLNLPDGEAETTNNLIRQFPDVAENLEKRLLAWDATLPPPGLPRAVNQEDQNFFDMHVKLSAPAVRFGISAQQGASRKSNAAVQTVSANQGWIARNCELYVTNGALHLKPGADGSRPFITRNDLDLAGPVTVTLRLRSAAPGSGEIAWRLQGQSDFSAGQTAKFDFSPGDNWQEVKMKLPSIGQLIHIRVIFSKDLTPEISAIEMCGANTVVLSRWPDSPVRK